MTVDAHAVIDPSAQIAANVDIGPWTVIGPNVSIGEGTVIGSHVVIERDTQIGCHNKIHQFASIGADPQDIDYQDSHATRLEIGDHNVIREFTTLNRGSIKGQGITRIGHHNFLMAYVHVAHDCQIGDHVIFANNASIAGHVSIDNHVILGAFTGIHQFCQIGAYSFLGRATKIYQDILPYMLVTGNPGAPSGLNSIGLKRHGFSNVTLRQLKQAFKLFYHRDLKLNSIYDELKTMLDSAPEMQAFLDMLDNTQRGIARPQLRAAEQRQQADAT